eukprot:COSAG06_NODE_9991_length_1773_cov_109.959976_1_plen_127_part_10
MFSCLLAVAAGGSPACESLLAASCPEASPGRGGRGGRGGGGRGGPRGACERCTGVIQHSLRVAGCTAVDVAAYCNQIATARWHHKWDTGAEMWFSDSDNGSSSGDDSDSSEDDDGVLAKLERFAKSS